MIFQSEVNSNIQALGNAGQIAKGYHSYCNVVDYVAGDNISVGEFAQTSVNESEVKATNGKAITGAIVGIVLRDSLKNSNTNTPSTIIPAGDNVAIIDSGNVYIETDEVANVGDFVFLDSTNGNLHFSDRLEVGYTATGWSVFIGNTTGRRGVIGITTDNEVDTPPLPVPLGEGVIFTAQASNSSVTLNKQGTPTELQLEYQTTKGDVTSGWQDYTLGTTINLNANDKVSFRNKGTQTITQTTANYHYFTLAGEIKAENDLTFLFDGTGGIDTIAEYGCYKMFSGCSALTEMPDLSATNIGANGYANMFEGCTRLKTSKPLPATTLADSCYSGMFYQCSNLTTAPSLPATTLANNCYQNMFNRCASLTTAPELPATTLADYCYRNMFNRCTSITTAPEIPATTLADSCYRSMFFGCTSLTTAPSLPATTLASYCYSNMFDGCTKLKVRQGGSGNKIFTCPSTSGLTDPVTDMFKGTGGTFTGTPTTGNTYNWYN